MRRLTDSFIQLSDKAQDRVNIGKIETSDSYLLSLLSRANTSSNAPALPLYFASLTTLLLMLYMIHSINLWHKPMKNTPL